MTSAKQILSADDIQRAITRIAHEVAERNGGMREVVLIGIRQRGVPISNRIAALAADFEGVRVPVGALDIALYRDDLRMRADPPVVRSTSLPADINGRTVVLVDDVLYTGRTARAALDALADLGRAAQVQLAVLVDRGHRELPIRADYVGKNLPTSRAERVETHLHEIDGEDGVFIIS